jgi:hypothetical protein
MRSRRIGMLGRWTLAIVRTALNHLRTLHESSRDVSTSIALAAS